MLDDLKILRVDLIISLSYGMIICQPHKSGIWGRGISDGFRSKKWDFVGFCGKKGGKCDTMGAEQNTL